MAEWASREIFSSLRIAAFIDCPQTRSASSENARVYDKWASGAIIYTYVRNNPLSYIDPYGLNPIAGAIEGGIIAGPPGAIVGGIIGFGIGVYIGDKMFNEKSPPDRGPPGEWIDGENRSRKYGPDGKPEIDIDYGHQGYPTPHVHEWPGGEREHPGRDVCPL